MISKPTKHMQELCKKLGKEYFIDVIDHEYVIYRDFHNGYDVEISGANTTSVWKTVTIYLWKDKTHTVKMIEKVPQSNIGDRVEELRFLIENNLIEEE